MSMCLESPISQWWWYRPDSQVLECQVYFFYGQHFPYQLHKELSTNIYSFLGRMAQWKEHGLSWEIGATNPALPLMHCVMPSKEVT